MKIFYKKNRSKKKFYDVIEEANKMRRVQNHPNIVKCFDLIETQERLIMLIEFVEGGQLYDEILKRKPSYFCERMAGKIVGELTDAIRHMHTQGVIHCDLKPENVLCTHNPSTDHFDIKVADMGLSKILEKDEKQTLTYCGTPLYMAPEMLRKEQYSLPVDLWSIGCMMHELMCGDPPFTGKDMFELERNVKSYKGLRDGSNSATRRIKTHFSKFRVSETAQDLIGKYLTPDPRQRIDAATAMKHPWIANNEELSNVHMATVHVNLQLATEKRKFRRAINKIIIAQKISRVFKGEDLPTARGASPHHSGSNPHAKPPAPTPSAHSNAHKSGKQKETEDTGCNCVTM
jgi:serine/threonine protein kinase